MVLNIENACRYGLVQVESWVLKIDADACTYVMRSARLEARAKCMCATEGVCSRVCSTRTNLSVPQVPVTAD